MCEDGCRVWHPSPRKSQSNKRFKFGSGFKHSCVEFPQNMQKTPREKQKKVEWSSEEEEEEDEDDRAVGDRADCSQQTWIGRFGDPMSAQQISYSGFRAIFSQCCHVRGMFSAARLGKPHFLHAWCSVILIQWTQINLTIIAVLDLPENISKTVITITFDLENN